MAKIVSRRAAFLDVAGTSFTGIMPPDYEVDDWIFWPVWNSTTTAQTTPTGWSVYTPDSGGNSGSSMSCYLFYKKVTSSSETAPTTTGGSGMWSGNMFVVRGAPSTNPIEFFKTSFSITQGTNFPGNGDTFSGGNNLMLYSQCRRQTVYMSPLEILTVPYLDGTYIQAATNLFVNYNYGVHIPTTAITTPTVYKNSFGAVFTLAIKDNDGTYIQPYIADPGCQVLLSGWDNTLTDDYVDAGAHVEDPTSTGDSTITTINGNSTNYSAGIETSNIFGTWTKGRGDGIVFNTTTTGLNIFRVDYNGTTVDLSGESLVTANIQKVDDWTLSDDGVIIVLEDSTGDWGAFNILEDEITGVGDTDYYWKFQPTTVTPVDHSNSGVGADLTDYSDIAKLSIAHYYNGATTSKTKRPKIQMLSAVTGPIILGGGGTDGARAKDIYTALYGMPMEHAFLQGNAQLYLEHGIQCGDASTACVLDFEFDSIEFVDNGASLSQFADGVIDIVGPTKSDSSLTLGAVNGVNQYDIDMPVGSAGTCLFVGPILNANNIVLRDPATFRAGCLFSGYDSMTQNDADFSVGVNFASSNDAQAITINGATQAALQTLLDNLANCSFTSNTVGIRVEYTGTGDISLNFDANTWTSNTTDIHYNSTNASTLTAVMQNGSNASTKAISGSAVAVTISNDVTFTVNVQDGDGTGLTGAELTILTTGTQTEQYHVETMATSSEGFVFTAPLGVNVDIQVFKPGYDPYWESNRDLGSANSSITATLSAVQAYEA